MTPRPPYLAVHWKRIILENPFPLLPLLPFPLPPPLFPLPTPPPLVRHQSWNPNPNPNPKHNRNPNPNPNPNPKQP